MIASDDTPTLGGNIVLITIGAMLAAFMAFLDISIVNVALRDMQASFGTPLDQIAWVSTSYAIANIMVIPISGWLLERLGFKRLYTAAILVFVAASICCGLSWNLASLVLFRTIQGLAGGAIIPTSQSVLFSRYPRRKHGMAGALFAMGATTGPLLGPTIGGHLVELSSWHLVFFVNIPVGLLAAYFAWTQIDQRDFVPSRAPVDRYGIGLLAIGLGSLQYVLEEGPRNGGLESTKVWVLTIAAVIALVAFVSHELETPHPVVDLRIFANRDYSVSTALNMLMGSALFGSSLMLSLFCGAVLHYRALDIGEVFLRATWLQLFIFPIAGWLTPKIDPRLMLATAFASVITSLWLNAHLTQTADMGAVVTALMGRAIGSALGIVPLTVVAVASLRGPQLATGTALFNVTRELGGSIGTALMITRLESEGAAAFTAITTHVDVHSPLLYERIQLFQSVSDGRATDPLSAALKVLHAQIEEQALVAAFNHAFLYLTTGFVAVSLLVFLVRRPRSNPQRLSNDPESTPIGH